MAKRFEYRVCQVQEARVTFVNGKWQGKMDLSPELEQEALKSCSEVWEYLRQAGADGWELAGTASMPIKESGYQLLYLKREHAV